MPAHGRLPEATPAEQDEMSQECLLGAARATARIGATVLIQPLSGPKPYPLPTDSEAVVDPLFGGRAPNDFLCDLCQLASNGYDVTAAIRHYAPLIAHAQIANDGEIQRGTHECLTCWASAPLVIARRAVEKITKRKG